VPEYEPACPEHSEHVYDPIQGMWIVRTEVPAKPERPTDPWAESLEQADVEAVQPGEGGLF
jgi:hypothetical protein